jgi:hypothetical protein
MSLDDFCRRYRIGRTKTYEEINAGRLKARKAGRRTIIAEDDAEEWLSLLPAFHGGLNEPPRDPAGARPEASAQLSTQESLPTKPTAAADTLKQNVSQAGATPRENEFSSRRSKENRPIAYQASGGDHLRGVKTDEK